MKDECTGGAEREVSGRARMRASDGDQLRSQVAVQRPVQATKNRSSGHTEDDWPQVAVQRPLQVTKNRWLRENGSRWPQGAAQRSVQASELIGCFETRGEGMDHYIYGYPLPATALMRSNAPASSASALRPTALMKRQNTTIDSPKNWRQRSPGRGFASFINTYRFADGRGGAKVAM